MPTILEAVLSNVAIATLLAAIAMAVSRCFRCPPVAYALWLLVLLKLVTPPVLSIPVPFFPEHLSSVETSHARLVETSRSVGVSTESAAYLAADLPIDPATQLDYEPNRPAADETGETEAIALAETPVQPFADAAKGASVRSADHLDTNLRVANASTPLPASSSFPWREIILGVWLIGSVVWVTLVLVRVRRFYREVRRPWPVDAGLQLQADELARRFGLRRPPVVRLVDATVPPMLWAVAGPPVILLPRPLVARLSSDQRNTLLAHELAHYCRRDHWVRWLEVLVLAVYWWNPLAWLARRELQRVEEQCCDAWVLWALPEDSCAYARAILETVDFLDTDRRLAPALATGLGPTGLLERRFEMILYARPMRRLTTNVNLALVLIGLAVLPISAKGQVATSPVTPTDARVDTATAPQVHPVLVGELTPPTVEAAAPQPSISATLTAPVATSAAATPPVDGQNSMEQRLQRLERMVESILSEVKDQPTEVRNRLSRRVLPDLQSSSNGRAVRQGAISLTDLKKQRIDIEDELDRLKDRLNEIDGQIAKLQDVRSRSGSEQGGAQVR